MPGLRFEELQAAQETWQADHVLLSTLRIHDCLDNPVAVQVGVELRLAARRNIVIVVAHCLVDCAKIVAHEQACRRVLVGTLRPNVDLDWRNKNNVRSCGDEFTRSQKPDGKAFH